MKEYVEHVHKYSTKNQQRLDKVCHPLLSLGISTFWYDTMSTDGYFTCLGNKGSVGEFFAANKLYKGHPGFRHPDLSTHAIEFPDLLYGVDKKYEETQGVIRQNFKSDKTLFLKERRGNILHVYGFQATIDHFAMTQVYLNYLHLLKKFISYFKQETADILRHVYEDKVHIGPACGKDFFRILPTDNAFVATKKVGQYLKMIGEESQSVDELPKFSSRELDCIPWIVKGRTAQQIADKLGLSKRTVEQYIESMKNKLGCQSKAELIDTLALLQPYFYF